MVQLKDISTLDAHAAERLGTTGVRTTAQLIEMGATSAGRMRLADQSGLDDQVVKYWVHQADLLRIDGVDPQLASLLCAAGVCTVPKLAYQHAPDLHAALVTHCAASDTQVQPPDQAMLRQIIAQAKKLPKLVRH